MPLIGQDVGIMMETYIEVRMLKLSQTMLWFSMSLRVGAVCFVF